MYNRERVINSPVQFRTGEKGSMSTFYSFFNEDLGEEFKLLFYFTRKSSRDIFHIKDIRDELCSTNWDREHFIIGEPLDPSFPLFHFHEGSIQIMERPSGEYNANALMYQLDSMQI